MEDLGDLLDDFEALLWDSQPDVEGVNQLAANVLAGHLRDVVVGLLQHLPGAQRERRLRVRGSERPAGNRAHFVGQRLVSQGVGAILLRAQAHGVRTGKGGREGGRVHRPCNSTGREREREMREKTNRRKNNNKKQQTNKPNPEAGPRLLCIPSLCGQYWCPCMQAQECHQCRAEPEQNPLASADQAQRQPPPGLFATPRFHTRPSERDEPAAANPSISIHLGDSGVARRRRKSSSPLLHPSAASFCPHGLSPHGDRLLRGTHPC